jgi:linoleoyl-CoA desaturase
MSTSTNLRYSNAQSPEFFKELSKRVNHYFKSNNLNKHANGEMYVKTIILLVAYLAPLVLMITGVVQHPALLVMMWAIMGVAMAGIGLAVMHDACHSSYSKNNKVNMVISGVMHLIGGNTTAWKIQHNILHHTYTNVHGYDEDIETDGILRFSPTQKLRKHHKYQYLFAPFLYGLMTFFWFASKDYTALIRYKKKDLLKTQNTSLFNSLVTLTISRAIYSFIFIVLPLLYLNIAWYYTLLLFFMMHFIASIILSFIFQLAHVIQETAFFVPNDELLLENHWAIHQLKTTANFANNSGWLTWYSGGLNHQIEHHLFPNICHIHYRKIAPIIKETAQEYNLPYYGEQSFFEALKNHFGMLKKLGTPESMTV